jgi:hypothetical protein
VEIGTYQETPEETPRLSVCPKIWGSASIKITESMIVYFVLENNQVGKVVTDKSVKLAALCLVSRHSYRFF